MVKYHMPLSKLISLLISNKKEFNHFFKSRSSDIVLLKLGNLMRGGGGIFSVRGFSSLDGAGDLNSNI